MESGSGLFPKHPTRRATLGLHFVFGFQAQAAADYAVLGWGRVVYHLLGSSHLTLFL